MSKKKKKKTISEQDKADIAQQVGDQLKQSPGITNHGDASGRSRTTKGAFFWGAASGIAVILAAPALRPVARTLVKTGIKAGRHAQQMGTSLKEEFEDIAAEARADLDREQPLEGDRHPGEA